MNSRMRLFFTLFLALCACSIIVGQKAQDDADKARNEVCQRVECRPPTTVRLRLNNKEYFEMEFPRGPYVADGFINVLAGEEFNVEFDESEGRLANPHYVKTSTKPERTLSLKLEQTDEGTVLSVKNPFAREIMYDCLIQHYKEQRLRKTSVVPVGSRLVSFELWPYPVAQVVISNVHYVSQK